MSDLAEFLLARIAEDEQAARELDGARWERSTDVGDEYNVAIVLDTRYPLGPSVARCGVEYMEDGETRAAHIVRWDPARVLAECATKRLIVTEHADEMVDPCVTMRYPCPTLKMLAQPYASHPHFHPSWMLETELR